MNRIGVLFLLVAMVFSTLAQKADTTPPTVVAVVGTSTQLNLIVISFSKPMDPEVLDPGSFFLYEAGWKNDPATTPYSTYSLWLTNATNVVMWTDPRNPTTNYWVSVQYAQDNSPNHNVLQPLPTDVPVVAQFPPPNPPQMKIVRDDATRARTISWSNGGTLQQATAWQNGGTVWTDVPGHPTNPFVITPAAAGRTFYRVR